MDRGLLTLADKGNEEDVKPAEVLVVLDLAMEEGMEEEEAPQEDSKTDTDGNTDKDSDIGGGVL